MVNYFFLREEKKRRKRTFRPGELFHFQIKPDNAIKTQEKAIKLLEKDGMTEELSEFKKHLDSYKIGKPWRD